MGLVTIYVLGQKYRVPGALTIMKALEYIGFVYTHGCGCRGGFCGACGTMYRLAGDHRILTGLACATKVEDQMYLVQLPQDPSRKPTYDVTQLAPSENVLLNHYPDIAKCVACNTCTKACPQDILVMDYVQAALRGDIETAAKLSFDCIMCGLCSLRCPADIRQYQVAILARRLYGAHIVDGSKELAKRVKKIEAGDYEADYKKLMAMDDAEFKKLYYGRDKEPR